VSTAPEAAGSRIEGPFDDPPPPQGVLLAALKWLWDGAYLVTETAHGDRPKGLLIIRADGSSKPFRVADPLEARDAILADYARRPVQQQPLQTGALQRRIEFERTHPEVNWAVPSVFHRAMWTEHGKRQEEAGVSADALLRRLRERGFQW
jgi:hypothetical protein